MLETDLNFHWKTVVDTIQDGVMIVDRRGKIVSVNHAFERITGYTKAEAVGKPCQLLNCNICKSIRNSRDWQWCELFKTGRVSLNRCTMTRKDGRRVQVVKNASCCTATPGR